MPRGPVAGDSPAMDRRPGLTDDERAELDRLRAEVATLRTRARSAGVAAKGGPTGVAVRQRWRTVIATLLMIARARLGDI